MPFWKFSFDLNSHTIFNTTPESWVKLSCLIVITHAETLFWLHIDDSGSKWFLSEVGSTFMVLNRSSGSYSFWTQIWKYNKLVNDLCVWPNDGVHKIWSCRTYPKKSRESLSCMRWARGRPCGHGGCWSQDFDQARPLFNVDTRTFVGSRVRFCQHCQEVESFIRASTLHVPSHSNPTKKRKKRGKGSTNSPLSASLNPVFCFFTRQ